MQKLLLSLVICALTNACQTDTDKSMPVTTEAADKVQLALPSWADDPGKRIRDWVNGATDSASADFIPVEDRIAVFDNDGTLWPEQPIPNQLQYAIDYIRTQSEVHPEWQKDPTLKRFINDEPDAISKAGKKGLVNLVGLSHFNLTTDQFRNHVLAWGDTARDRRFGRRYMELVYQPMLELLEYLRVHGFKIYIVSGGGADFMRAWTEEVYGIPPYQVIGSYGEAKFELKDGVPVITKTAGALYVDDQEGKPVAIHRFIGKVPVFCGGNSDGDLAMMQYTAGSKYKSLNLLLHHTDSTREYAYDVKTLSGHLEKALVEANTRGWLVVDMQRDFRKVFPFEK